MLRWGEWKAQWLELGTAGQGEGQGLQVRRSTRTRRWPWWGAGRRRVGRARLPNQGTRCSVCMSKNKGKLGRLLGVRQN